MIKNYFDKSFDLRYFEMNNFGFLSPASVLTLLEETAAEHCWAINHSLYQLKAQNIGWILFSGMVQMNRYPAYKERITIRTWLSKYTMFKGIRENLIYDQNEKIIGKAQGVWVFFDIEERKPKPIFEDIKAKWASCDKLSVGQVPKVKPTIQKVDYQASIKVNKCDIDEYKHVNNIRYLQWVMEAIPDEITDNYYLHQINGRFISEANLGQTIISATEKMATQNTDKAFQHSISVGETICAAAHTVWRK